MRVLFIHQNFPGQFRHVASALAQQPESAVVALTDATNKQTIKGVSVGRYPAPAAPPAGLSRAAATLFNRFRRGEVVANALVELKRRGFEPDVIVGHPGWGELMMVKEIFPRSPLIAHAEFFYAAEGADVGFDPEFPDLTDELRVNLKAKNLPLLAALHDCTMAIAPTRWQASRFPSELAGKIKTMHEGIQTDLIRPDPAARFSHGLDGRVLKAGDEVITFVNRNLEPLRGYHVFMRALPAIMAARPEARAVIVGGSGVSYGAPPPGGGTWKDRLLDEVKDRLPPERVHFVGNLPYPAFVSLMQVSAVHAYATYPFVLSWSMLEAMSAGALVIGSSTAPVTEMIEHEKNGLLFDFFDVEGLAHLAIDGLANPDRFRGLRARARETIVERYDLRRVALPAWLDCVAEVASTGPAIKQRQ